MHEFDLHAVVFHGVAPIESLTCDPEPFAFADALFFTCALSICSEPTGTDQTVEEEKLGVVFVNCSGQSTPPPD